MASIEYFVRDNNLAFLKVGDFAERGFDAFDPPGKVTDTQFRIDLPILMLYLDKHKPTAKSFINHLAENGTLDVEYKEIIRPFVP